MCQRFVLCCERQVGTTFHEGVLATCLHGRNRKAKGLQGKMVYFSTQMGMETETRGDKISYELGAAKCGQVFRRAELPLVSKIMG